MTTVRTAVSRPIALALVLLAMLVVGCTQPAGASSAPEPGAPSAAPATSPSPVANPYEY